MDCITAQQMLAAALASAEPVPAAAQAHAGSCPACAREAQRLAETWAALGVLPALEPSALAGRRLLRRVRREAAFEALVSPGAWQRAALVGVGAFALALLLSLALPWERLVAACRDLVAQGLPAAGAYVLAGAFYGLLPMAAAGGLQAGLGGRLPGSVGVVEAVIVFLAVLVPYVVAACGFPPPLLAAFAAGLAAGAVAGGLAGHGLARRLVAT
jgi:hypothetical protein